MPGSKTTPGHSCACDDALEHVAFRQWNGVDTRDKDLSRLNGWPMRTPVNASRRTSRCATHDSGTT